jgi:hypothetical protein
VLYEHVNRVVFFHIRDWEHPRIGPFPSGEKGKSARIRRNVEALLHSLAGDYEYRYFIGEKAGERVDLKNLFPAEDVAFACDLYSQALELAETWTNRDIEYSSLRSELRRIQREEPQSIIDVTAIKKPYLGDILAICLIESVKYLYTFDTPPNFDEPWKMLLDRLNPNAVDAAQRQYGYVNILDTQIFSDCARSILVHSLPVKLSLSASAVFLATMIAVYFLYGPQHWLIQISGIIATVATVLGLYLSLVPSRR